MASRPSATPRMRERGIACLVIGAAVRVAPRFLSSPSWREMVGGACLVGWAAVVLGGAPIALDPLQRARAGKR